ncbi:autotransporter assembly complex protein TamA [Ralstonia sp. UBA689]|uniref:autotransporter assembly complex protein TamA n=1 Tax=Ralstonia sp. UBA689 TaxID=1947373 RepID=UPI0025FD7E4A|nr:autotransporter assembly complex family protein [Ralstonia sp. UBA689]
MTGLKRPSRPPRFRFPAVHAAALAAGFVLSIVCAPAHAEYEVKIEAPKAIRDLLERHLDLSRYQDRKDITDAQLQYMVETVGEEVAKLTATEGYFVPKATAQLEGPPDHRVVRVKVDPGPRTTIDSVALDFNGAITQEPKRIEELNKVWGLPQGMAFRQAGWDKAKDDSLAALQSKRYYAAKQTASQARVDPDESKADLSVTYDSGPAYTLGPLDVQGLSRYPRSIIDNVNPLRVGEDYSADRLQSLQAAIQGQPYFANAIVDLGEDPKNPVDAPVRVRVREYPPNRITSGVGYGTDTGASVEGRYQYLNLFNKAWVLDTQARIEQRRQYLFGSVTLPPDEKQYVNSIYSSMDRTDTSGTDTRSYRSGFKQTRVRGIYETSFTIDYYYDDLRPEGAARQLSKALVPGFAWTRRNVDDPLFPRRGNIITTQIGAAVKGLLTDQSFVRSYSRIRQYVPVGQRDIFVARAELGGVITSGTGDGVPATLRFRTGGTQSIRGYDFQSIGNQVDGSTLPTKFLVTGGLEYQRWFLPQWGAAVFWDTGTATDNWSERRWFNGVGVGVRWKSPVGPIQVDLAYGIQQRQFRPSVSLGIAF